MIKSDFARGMEVIAERRAIMQNMTEEERAEYKAEMAAFMAEQGLSENRYSLSALKSVDAEDVANMTAFMEQLAMDMGGPIDGPLPEKDQSEVRSLSESFSTLIRNISGSELNDDERQAMSHFLDLIRDAGVDTALVEAQAKVVKTKGKDPVANTIMAALIETKSEMPIASFISGDAFALRGDRSDNTSSQQVEATGDEAIEDVLALLPVPIQRGIVQIPNDDALWDAWYSAAKSVPISDLSGPNVMAVASNKSCSASARTESMKPGPLPIAEPATPFT